MADNPAGHVNGHIDGKALPFAVRVFPSLVWRLEYSGYFERRPTPGDYRVSCHRRSIAC